MSLCRFVKLKSQTIKKSNTIFLMIITPWHSFKNQKFLLQSLNIPIVFNEMDLFIEVWAFI